MGQYVFGLSLRMEAWRESFGETSGDVETEISGITSETRGVIVSKFKGEISGEIGGKNEKKGWRRKQGGRCQRDEQGQAGMSQCLIRRIGREEEMLRE